MTKKLITIAIDGFSSSGKSTMAKVLAKNIGYAYIDSGAMYRAVTLYCLDNGLINDAGEVNLPALEAAIGDIKISFGRDRRYRDLSKWRECGRQDSRHARVGQG